MAAALELVAEDGIDSMTMDSVATRAGVSKAALYRRWTSKEALVVDAIVATGWNALDSQLPSTGDLRDDLIRIIGTETGRATTSKTRVLSGVLSIISRDAVARQAITDAIIEPRERAIRRALAAAVARGEIDAEVDITLIASALPAMLVYRLLVRGEPVSRRWQYTIVDQLLLPSVRVRSAARVKQ